MGSGFLKKKKQAKMLQQQMSNMQDTLTSKLEHTEVTGVSGNGLVSITLNGLGEMKTILIKPECIDPEDAEGLQTLIKAAHNHAQEQLQGQSDASRLTDLAMLGF